MARVYFKLFYDQYQPMVNRLSREEAGDLFLGLLNYLRFQQEPELSGKEDVIWALMKEDIDKNRAEYERKCAVNAANARLGGRGNKGEEPPCAQTAPAGESSPAEQPAPQPVPQPAPQPVPQPVPQQPAPYPRPVPQRQGQPYPNKPRRTGQDLQARQRAEYAASFPDGMPRTREEYEAKMNRMLAKMRGDG
jgi:hypothetical protein